MGWTKVVSRDTHVCDIPRYAGEGIVDGDVIRCDCGQHWECTGKEYGMQWDPLPRPVLRWERVSIIP